MRRPLPARARRRHWTSASRQLRRHSGDLHVERVFVADSDGAHLTRRSFKRAASRYHQQSACNLTTFVQPSPFKMRLLLLLLLAIVAVDCTRVFALIALLVSCSDRIQIFCLFYPAARLPTDAWLRPHGSRRRAPLSN